MDKPLLGKTVLITGGARRIGRYLALSIAQAGADIVLHHSNSAEDAADVALEIQNIGQKCQVIRVDFNNLEQINSTFDPIWQDGQIYGLINNAAIFAPLTFAQTTLEDWQTHLKINLTAPFMLCQAFYNHLGAENRGRIINILDWRALRPAADHFPYTISKAALASMTKSLAVAMAPRVTVNGLALGAIIPPSDGGNSDSLLQFIPAERWARLDEVAQAILFLLGENEYITGEIIHIDGGRHLI